MPKIKYQRLQSSIAEHGCHRVDESNGGKEDDLDAIVECLPAKLKESARLLLRFMKVAGRDVIDWNDDTELRANGIVVPETDVRELIKDAISEASDSHLPSGYQSFYRAFSDIGTPSTALYNERAKTLLAEGGAELIRPVEPPEQYSAERVIAMRMRRRSATPPGKRANRDRKQKWISF